MLYGRAPEPTRRRAAAVREARLRFRRQRRNASSTSWVRLATVAITLPLLLVVSLFATMIVGAPTALAFAGNFADLPSAEGLRGRDVFRTTKIVDRNNVLLYEVFDPNAGKRTVLKYEQIPTVVKDATIATEDASFYTNEGYDPIGIIRAFYQAATGTGESGGSTITQQLVRNVLIPEDERTRFNADGTRKTTVQLAIRKAKEILLAVQVAERYKKEEILTMYLNEIGYGGVHYGIEAAAQGYFGKSVNDLTLAEASLLAGLPQSPVNYNPLVNLPAAKQRQSEVLGLMLKQNYITAEQQEIAQDAPLEFKSARYDIKAGHFVDYVRGLMETQYGDQFYRGGLTIKTTLDYNLQEKAETILRDHVASIAQFNVQNAALVSLDPKTGEILAMVGSADYFDTSIRGQVNVATRLRQPGSSIKPIAYVTAFQKGYTPATTVLDEAMTIPDANGKSFAPKNNDNIFHGPVTLRTALAQSMNIPAIKVLQFAGLLDMIETSRAMGITSFTDPSRYGLSLSLGGGEVELLELTGAYGVFATGGIRNDPVGVLEVKDGDGGILFQRKANEGKRVLSPELAYLITDILSDNNARSPVFGADNPLRLSRPAAAKTGTTDDSKDAWTLGYTPDLVTGVWVGNTIPSEMRGILGSRAAGPIWNRFMEAAHQGKPVSSFSRPANIVQVSVCAEKAANGECARSATDLGIRGIPPRASNDIYIKKAKVCKTDGKLADEGSNPDDVEDRSFLLTTDGLPDDLARLGLPLLPKENGSCSKNPSPSATPGTPGPGTPSAVASGTPRPTTTPGTPRPATSPTAAVTAGAIAVSIGQPSSGQSVKGTVSIDGSASVPNFASYKIEVAQGESGGARRTVAELDKAITNGSLAKWNTAGFPNGVYTVILTVFDRAGKATERTISVRVAN